MLVHQGNLIVIEGGDGAGKATQTELLFKALKKTRSVSMMDFPRYKKSQFGKLIRRSLDGEFGDFLNLSPYLSSLPYMLDRARAKYLLLEQLKEGDVICDRYTPSNLAHQGAKLPQSEQSDFINFIEEGEYKELGLPMPDIVIYLWVPSEVSHKSISFRSKKQSRPIDQHEAAEDYQEKVVQMYLNLAKGRRNWHIVKCVDAKGKLLSRLEVHKQVLRIIQKEFNIRL